jgi:hypothetical protein
MVDKTPAAIPVESMTPAEAGATLLQMQLDARPLPPLVPSTASEAQARLQTLTGNAEWGKRLLAGHTEERREFERLTGLAAGADNIADAIAGTTPQPFAIETVGPGELNSRDQAAAVAMFRDAGLSDGVVNEAMRGGTVTRKELAAAKALQSSLHGDEAWRQRFLKGGWNETRTQWLLNTVFTSAIREE